MVQVLVMVVSLVIIGRVVYAGRVSLGKAWQAYVVLCTGFAGIYYLIWVFDHRPECPDRRFAPRTAFVTTEQDINMYPTWNADFWKVPAGAARGAPAPPSQLRAEAFPLWVLMMYLSVATQTSVGFGDVVPNSILAEYRDRL